MNIKGRILIYTTFDCVSCVKSKQKLEELNLPYTEVVLDSFPSLKEEVKRRTGRNTVPQIFFNEIHIGGYEDLQKAVEDETYFNKLMFVLQTNSPPHDAPRIPDPHTSIDMQHENSGIVGEIDEMVPIVDEMKLSGMIKHHKMGLLKSCKNIFTGHELIQWLYDKKDIDNETALNIGQKLINRHLLHDVKHNIDETFRSDGIYKLLEDEYQNALNFSIPSRSLPLTIGQFEEIFRQTLTNLYRAGKTVSRKDFFDYQLLVDLPEFNEYLNIITLMQRLNFVNSGYNERLAFFINVYNALAIHAKIKFGYPNNIWQRYKLFKNCNYVIGGYSFSLFDIANGVLRSNKKPFGCLLKPFGNQDARLNVSFTKVELLVHFALTFGSKSCPPLKIFSSKAIKSELKVATESFLATNEALQVDVNNKQIKLNFLFKWYEEDFGSTKKDLLQFILRHMEESMKRNNLKAVFESNTYVVLYLPYDWSKNVQT